MVNPYVFETRNDVNSAGLFSSSFFSANLVKPQQPPGISIFDGTRASTNSFHGTKSVLDSSKSRHARLELPSFTMSLTGVASMKYSDGTNIILYINGGFAWIAGTSASKTLFGDHSASRAVSQVSAPMVETPKRRPFGLFAVSSTAGVGLNSAKDGIARPRPMSLVHGRDALAVDSPLQLAQLSYEQR